MTSEAPEAGKWGVAPVTQPPLSFRSGSSMGLEVFGILGARTAPGTGRRVRLAPPGDPAVTSWWWRQPGDTSAPQWEHWAAGFLDFVPDGRSAFPWR